MTLLSEDPKAGETERPTVPSSPRPRRRVRVLVLSAGGLVAVGAVAWAAIGFDAGADPGPEAPSGPPATAKIEQRTLTETETVSGALGYGDVHTASVAAGQAGVTGTITWIPAEGDIVKRGGTVYGVDGRKVPLLFGTTPVYRTLSSGVEGKDVKMLERNLAALGYAGFTVDAEFTSATSDAVSHWQEDLGLDETGVLAKGDAVVAPGAVRVAQVHLGVGDAATGPVVGWTDTARLVTVDLEPRFEDLVSRGTKATVELPNGDRVDATVTSVGTTATAAAPGGAGAAAPAAEDATVAVELAVGDQKGLGRYQASPVDVTFTSAEHKDVLAVPVTALVALREGGYAVEAVGEDGTTGYVWVETGAFANGLVEIRGEGLAAGMTVGVPK
ncbi:putative peptidoglycan binding protein [Actinocorallia herbida]|uniref:Putative peptidoglycan binding protein n=1 Tax=Actinocorallia herbida TaxID=58109 RepID=A0A3N1CZM8_9ACTN|nr:peptidoglycan-binding domain-containing protein [Actinocorallia herbida]ROO86702.1 putative peptidoglycan binding protein [Actinocorallia herbida]